MLNKNEMNSSSSATDVDVDLLAVGIGEMLDGILDRKEQQIGI